MLKLKKILVPVDFSKEAELALEWAVKLAKEEREATIYLLRVLAWIPITEPGSVDITRIVEAERDVAKKKLEAWRRKIPPPLSSEGIIVDGNLVREIVATCEKNGIDLVVMTTHGRHGLKRLAHPNVSEQVVRDAPCPVLVLHLTPKMRRVAKAAA